MYLANCDSLQISLLPQTDINKSVNVLCTTTFVINTCNTVCNWDIWELASIRSDGMFIIPFRIMLKTYIHKVQCR